MGRLIHIAAGASPAAALSAPHEFEVEMPEPLDRFFTLGLEDLPLTEAAAAEVTTIVVTELVNSIVGYVAGAGATYVDTTAPLPHEIPLEGLQSLTQVGHLLMIGVETFRPGHTAGHVRLRLRAKSDLHPAFYTVWWGRPPGQAAR